MQNHEFQGFQIPPPPPPLPILTVTKYLHPQIQIPNAGPERRTLFCRRIDFNKMGLCMQLVKESLMQMMLV